MKAPLHVVILSGGAGARLWPASRGDTTKPFLKLPRNETLLEQTVKRAERIVPRSSIWIVTTQNLVKNTLSVLPGWPSAQLIAEPEAKNTAPACMLAAREIQKRVGSAVTLLVLPADHYIPDDALATDTLLKGAQRAAEGASLVTFGIKVREPKTDYGYIQVSPRAPARGFYKVKRFVEKPNAAKAKAFAKSKNYFWNSGMFSWRSDVFLEEMKRHAPKIHAAFDKGKSIENVYSVVENLSIDYALMEKTDLVELLPCRFFWSDLGTWASVYEALCTERNANVAVGNVRNVEAHRNLMFTRSKPWVLFGVDDLVIVESDDVIMVTTRQKSHDLKSLLSKL